MPYFGWNFSTLPGTLDTLFNRYVLEHGYLWLMGEEPSFWNAPFFYPAPLALAYSDCHAGNLPFYALFRIAGFGPDGALQCWILLQYLLNFAACVWMLRKLEFSRSRRRRAVISSPSPCRSPPSSLISSYCRASRFRSRSAPSGFFWQKPNLRCFSLLIGALFWQFACSIYLGTLLLLALGVFFLLSGDPGPEAEGLAAGPAGERARNSLPAAAPRRSGCNAAAIPFSALSGRMAHVGSHPAVQHSTAAAPPSFQLSASGWRRLLLAVAPRSDFHRLLQR
ncbi:MAG: hypothetical protein L6W00_19130 [Lentisphaeria bacterium]|nr:MAG: hypothetical protein L6W00_19130 [Lentisphaeria bacterium]